AVFVRSRSKMLFLNLRGVLAVLATWTTVAWPCRVVTIPTAPGVCAGAERGASIPASAMKSEIERTMNSDDRCAVDRVQERTHFLEGKFSPAGEKASTDRHARSEILVSVARSYDRPHHRVMALTPRRSVRSLLLGKAPRLALVRARVKLPIASERRRRGRHCRENVTRHHPSSGGTPIMPSRRGRLPGEPGVVSSESVMFDIGLQELILIFVIALLVFGPKNLPQLGRSLGRAMREFRKASDEFKSTIETNLQMNEIDPPPTLQPASDVAALPVETTPLPPTPEPALDP